jgi:phospholipid/cholesterol/gamma-HCH transport system substrate-binding protein
MASVNNQNGTMGKLLSDGDLYNNLTMASDNLTALLADLKENPHRYINISVFGANPTKKVEKAKAKAEKRAIKRADELAEEQHEQQIKELKSAE